MTYSFAIAAVDGAKVDDAGQRRLSQEIESEQLPSSRRPTVFVLPSPALLVGWVSILITAISHRDLINLVTFILHLSLEL